VDKSFALHSRVDTSHAQEIGRSLFQNAGSDSVFHMDATLSLQNDRLDAVQVEKLCKKQAGGA
jgi:hypothetical protein